MFFVVPRGIIQQQVEAGAATATLQAPMDAISSSPSASYSVSRRCFATWDDPVVNLREDNGSTNQDFEVTTGGELLTSTGGAVSDWLTANSASTAYIEIYYNQQGATGLDLIQTTHGDQPEYVATGFGGKPGYDTQDTSYFTMGTAHIGAVNTGAMVFTIRANTATGSRHLFTFSGSSGNERWYIAAEPGVGFWARVGNGSNTTAASYDQDEHIMSVRSYATANSFEVEIDGTSAATGSNSSSSVTAPTVFDRSSRAEPADLNGSEIHCFSADPGGSDIDDLVANMKSFFGI